MKYSPKRRGTVLSSAGMICVWLAIWACTASIASARDYKALTTVPTEGTSLSPPSAPPVSVVDLIRLTKVADAPLLNDHQDFIWSPDERHAAIVVYRGNLEQNTRDFELLVFEKKQLQSPQVPNVVSRFSSSSNRPAITGVQWLADNVTLAFLAEGPGELPQVYTVDIRTRQQTQVTHATSVLRHFGIEASGETVAYVIDEKPDPRKWERVRERGFVLSPNAYLGNLLDSQLQAYNQTELAIDSWEVLLSNEPLFAPLETWIQRRGAPAHLLDLSVISKEYGSCSAMNMRLAPNGAMLLIPCIPKVLPPSWGEYAKGVAPAEPPEQWREWLVVNLRDSSFHPLNGAPIHEPPFTSQNAPLLWARDGRSVVVADALMPLGRIDVQRRYDRAAHRFVAEIDLSTGATAIVSPYRKSGAPSATIRWALPDNLLQVSMNDQVEYYKKSAGEWQPTKEPKQGLPHWRVDEGLNTPVTLVAIDRRIGKCLLYDLNPGLLTQHRFARVTSLRWSYAGESIQGDGTLYWPPDYVAGRRYPLVIQGHGESQSGFWPDGNATTKHAAQPLANSNIFVAQISEGGTGWNQVDFATYRQTMFAQLEGIIDHLDRSGLIDRERVGLSGFSTDYGAFMLFMTHTTYPIKAAALAEGIEFSYFNYLTAMGHPWRAAWEEINGGVPWGEARATWLERAAGFNLERISAAIQFEASGDGLNILEVWEGYQGMRRLGRPVELTFLPNATHLRVKPWHRMTSQQGAVDWFRFWLQGYERKEPVSAVGESAEQLAGQYVRWSRMANEWKRRNLDEQMKPKR